MRSVNLAFAAALLVSVNVIGGASAQQAVQTGTLNCDVSGGLGFIIASNKAVNCIFTPSAPGWLPEVYAGSISKFGLDIGATTASQMTWAVFAAGAPGPGSLSGSYAGATAEATFAVGLGANVLVGGSNRSIALQPLSVTGQTGFNAAGGVAVLQLSRVQ
jgi:Protein of unknown function (DUF992)